MATSHLSPFGEELLLVVQELLVRLGRELEVRPSTMASTGHASWQNPQ